jgi:hypothetical protein
MSITQKIKDTSAVGKFHNSRLEVTLVTVVEGHTMAQVVTCLPLTAESQVCTQISPCGISDGHNDTGTSFSQGLQFSPISVIPLGLNTDISSGR